MTYCFNILTETVNRLRGKCAIVGVGETQVGNVPGVTAMSHSLQAAKKAIEYAGLSSKDIDGVLKEISTLSPIVTISPVIGPRFNRPRNLQTTIESSVLTE